MAKRIRWPDWPTFHEADLLKIGDCLRIDHWSRGRYIEDFEVAFSRFCNCRFALLTNSGTEALKIALRAIGVGPTDEVLIPGLTWPATAVAALECGAKTIAVDIDQDTLGLSPVEVEKNITGRTKAIVAVHLYNGAADLKALSSIAEKYKISLVEDAAQVHGARWRGKQLGTIGRVAAFSFHEKKLLPCGEGGCLITDDPTIYEHAYALRDHGRLPNGSISSRCGSNGRISSINAALLLSRLERLPKLLHREREKGEYLSRQLNRLPGITCVSRPTQISFPTFYNFCFFVSDSGLKNSIDEIRTSLSTRLNGSFTASYPPLSEKTFFLPGHEANYKGLFFTKRLRGAWKAYRESVRFPHQYLLADREQLDLVESVVYNFVKDLRTREA